MYPEVEIVVNKLNPGFAGGNNIGIDMFLATHADYMLILNPDTILDKNCLENLLFQAETHVQPRILGPKIYSPDSRLSGNDKRQLWSVGGELDEKRYSSKLIGLNETDQGQYEESHEVPFISGTCMLLPREICESGLRFYEPYFMYYEDVEFCVRAKKSGFPSYIVPEAKIAHSETSEGADPSADGPEGVAILLKNYYLARNHLLFVERNAPFKVQLREILRLPKTILEHSLNHDKNSLYGIYHYVTRKFGYKLSEKI